jgi:two-component system NtrC family sensor kinase
MFRPRCAAVALKEGSRWEMAAVAGGAHRWSGPTQQRLADALASESPPAANLHIVAASRVLGRDVCESIGAADVIIAPMAASDGTTLGKLCLIDRENDLSFAEGQLLQALVSHASVAIENGRMFKQIELSRKQWVRDIDAISDFIVVHDPSGRVLRLNQALADALGTHPAQAVGKDIGEMKVLGMAANPGACPLCRNTAAEREEILHSTGNRTYLISASRIRFPEAGDVRTVHVMKDITERRDAERRYRREHDFNRSILNNTQSMIVVLDTAGLVSYANRRCFEMGYDERDLLGHSFLDMVSPGRRAPLSRTLDRALSGDGVENFEMSMLRPNGSSGQFSISLSAMRDDSGEVSSIVAVMTDVTDAAGIQAKLMHTEKMAALGQLVSGVAHEINNPLAAIVGFTDLLLEDTQVPEDSKPELRLILEEAQRTQLIVRNLLSFARQVPAQREPVQINSVLQQTLRLRAYDPLSNGIELRESYARDLPLAIGDAHQFQQVFLNILNNAFDALQEAGGRGRIAISTSHTHGFIEIAFEDNGPGISHPQRIFDPFFTTKAVGKGTGLGLSICYGILKSHGGEISARNNPNGKGCTFLVRLPAARNAGKAD